MYNEFSPLNPASHIPAATSRKIEFVLTDIDDTLTTHGLMPAVAYEAIENLFVAGIKVIPVTGRPAGWCDMIARQWPVSAVVGENGALYYRYHNDTRRMSRFYAVDEPMRTTHKRRLDAIATRVLREVPGARIAADQAFRVTDLAIDFAEDCGPLEDEDVEQITRIFADAGATAKVSSIHVNGWFGDHDKLTTSQLLLEREFQVKVELPEQRETILFVGDSPNDEPMFRFFENSVGVANFSRYADLVDHAPRWLTTACGGEGFRELVDILLSGRDPGRRSKS